MKVLKQSRKVCTCLHGLGRFVQVAKLAALTSTKLLWCFVLSGSVTVCVESCYAHTHMRRPLALLRVLSVCVSTFASHFSHVIQNTEMR